MKYGLLASIVSLSLVLAACGTHPGVPSSYDEVYKSYMQGHVEMLRTHAPWMTETERQAHAQAQATEVIKSLKAQNQFGVVIPPIMIPLPAPPSTYVPKAVEDPLPPKPKAETANVEPLAKPDLQFQAPSVGAVQVDQDDPPPLEPSVAVQPLPPEEVVSTESSEVDGRGFLDGTYVLEGGNYSINIEQDGDNLVVVEPNKRSIYERQPDGSYQFYSENSGSTFSLRLLDPGTIETDRVPSAGTPSTLKRVEGRAAAQVSAVNQTYALIAEHYSELAQSDPDNVQVWTMCSAVAFKRSLSEDEDFSRYARQVSESLKSIAVTSTNPCSDAIPSSYW
ncbi:hypothetical protein E8F20_19020 [Pseudomonas sp. BN415]|uniref:hypothetical protein n=1 Tax=Pseudomonas sp. BN415 TaxID=2567889 RepID=UPI00245907F8|nr:hypothetical protein [Pseudomonas sp. BN415]MDH4583953.1 hypothetical protein [Pseudomonas sp. BN415]